MHETLRMMKSILNGKEEKVSEKELIKEYQEKMSPNILAYFYVNNFGLILQTSNKYSILSNEDIASFCLQELDLSLQDYDLESKNKFIIYFIKRFKNILNDKIRELNTNKRKVNTICESILDNELYCFDTDTENIVFSNYKLTKAEINQSKLRIAGYSLKEISEFCNLSYRQVYYINEKIKQKILKINCKNC